MTERCLMLRRATTNGRTQILKQHQAAHQVRVSKEEVHFLMANQTTEDEVFDFSNSEFTREDLINALNEMVHEYRKLSQTFKEIKAENNGLKNSSDEPSTAQLGESDSLQTELSKLKIENELLRTKSCFSFGENSSEETYTQSDLADMFKKMNFVKASVTHDVYDSVKYDDQITGQLNHKGKNGIDYIKPENCKPSWLTNRLEKDKAKAIPKLYVPNQQRRG
ncbi:hypothetical protein F511_22857 [Dorcoceras hygrometricum]|uniref:Uncharacterized protein n=1 Tax=Dorcoceras hygrometricum TaxID=472368 RepID=A0A2Z7ADP1_9LAMI|nr:hypothetical protein F511_22857 [Dorcoceras hygrometricum]